MEARERNRRRVLDRVRLDGPLSRAEVARRTGLSLQTVVTVAGELSEAGLLREEGVRRGGGRGAPAPLLGLRPEGGFTLGVSLDHRHAVVALVDLAGGVRRTERLSARGLPAEAALDAAAGAARAALRAARVGRARAWGLGLAMPLVFEGGRAVSFGPTSLPGWAGLDVRAGLARRLGLPVFVENDANAAAMGERLHGAGRRLRDFLYVYLGAGLGGGLMLEGRPYRGATGKAGELGHVPAVPGGRPCACGGRGCLERYCSLAAAQATLEGWAEGATAVDPDAIGAALARGHPALRRWVEEAGAHLGRALRGVAALLDPEAVVLGGSAGQPLLAALAARAAEEGGGAPILLGAEGDAIPALGAAALPLFERLAQG